MVDDAIAFILRTAACVVWLIVFIEVAADRVMFTFIRRLLTVGSLVLLLAAVVYGGAVGLGWVPNDAARMIYTAVATAILIAGLTVMSPGGDRA